MGTDYTCVTLGSSVSLPAGVNNDCPLTGSGGGAIVFTQANDVTQRNAAYRVITVNGMGVLQRCTPACVDLVAPNVDVQKLTFYVNGSSTSDEVQPSVYILLKGTVTIKGVPNVFAIQTMTSQRSGE
jgi:hypothetical protein